MKAEAITQPISKLGAKVEGIRKPMVFAFEAARLRRKKASCRLLFTFFLTGVFGAVSGEVTVVDKANVLECSRLWREVRNRAAETERWVSSCLPALFGPSRSLERCIRATQMWSWTSCLQTL